MKRYILIILLLTAIGGGAAKAQLNPLKSQYFQNEYLVNPAMAGNHGRPEVFVNYSNQWNKIDGAPVLSSISGSLPVNSKASFGINIINDKAGLIGKTQAMGSFSYKVPFSEDHALRFGVSISWSQDRLDYGRATSSGISDTELAKYNDRENYLDGNLGITYQYKDIEAQFSYLSLNEKRYSRISTVDYATFYSSLSYKIRFDGSFGVKPMFAYRGIKNYENQWDVAAEWNADQLRFYTMYHSNRSFTGGMGYLDRSGLFVSALYNSEPLHLRGFSGGIFDVVVGYRFGKMAY
ncbi:putative membrane protein [Pseudopedobacter saltans DSM 12145]|uniref:Membrane protein n=1 Tax=Pseudopedobacter saltans (strain ATCC 51119 / DSM 12145 / JCM 21818 / CCUG 39354 / LMG 10337 / NBRC 100064 / NCIMB 13643) TaxID=762903 RepID=F0SE45_PSESL|nr:PorP/SprF family type IX secretion system membrane protein [Pseudopedobacter saltans]ADY52971.1 putative membrane protein [Pseudopedobacter saltans DSM 12145]